MKPACLLAVAPLVSALGQQPVVAFNTSAGAFQIAGGRIAAGQVLVAENDYFGVIRAAGDLVGDLERVTGTHYTLSTDARLVAAGASNNSSSSSHGNASSTTAAAALYWFNPVDTRNNTHVCT